MSPSDVLFPPPGSTARLSDDGVYRYELARRWSHGPSVCWVMLNPSTADATLDDPTVRRCRSFSRAWGAGALTVVNLFALRSAYPNDLARLRTGGWPNPVGPENDDAIHDAVVRARHVVVAWGATRILVPAANPFREIIRERADVVLDLLAQSGRALFCLGRTNDGSPRHPVRLPRTAEVERFSR